MFEMAYYSVGALVATALPILFFTFVIGVSQIASQRRIGWFHLYFYVVLLTVAVQVAGSGRDLSVANWLTQESTHQVLPWWSVWETRAASLFFLASSGERIATWLLRDGRMEKVTILLPLYVIYWICAVASPSLLGRYPTFSYEYSYQLLFGCAALLCTNDEAYRAILAARNALLMLVFASLAFIPINSGLVLETQYSQGYIPGLARLAGLTPHALQMGLVVQVAIFCIWNKPLPNSVLNKAAWLMCLLALLLTQSKTAWLSFFVAGIAMTLVRHGAYIKGKIFNSVYPVPGITFVILCISISILVAYTVMFGEAGNMIMRFFDSDTGAKLLTLNGRQEIWDIAISEWRKSPIFGYGPSLFSLEFRKTVGLLNATHAHNQFVDDLGRAGLVGVTALLAYLLTLMYQSFRFAKSTGGLSVALFLIIFMRGISEVPLSMYNYGVDYAVHVLLLMILVSEIHKSGRSSVAKA